MCHVDWQERLQVQLTLAIFIITTTTLIPNIFFLCYWLHSEVNEDLPATPKFSLHLYTNSILLIFCLVTIGVNIKMYWMVYMESYHNSTFIWVCYVQVFIVTSYLMFSVIFTVLYTNFPLYNLASPLQSIMKMTHTTRQNDLNIPIWLDRFQSKYQCCGRNSYMDYKYNTEYKFNGLDRVPESCCKNMKEDWPQIDEQGNTACTTEVFSMIPVSTHLYINTQGCDKQLETVIESLTSTTMCFNWAITGLNMLGIVGFWLQLEKNHKRQGKCSQLIGDAEELEADLIHAAQQPQSSVHSSTSKNKSIINICSVHGNISTLFNDSNEDIEINSYSTKERPHQTTPAINKNQNHSSYDHFSRCGLMNVP